MEIHNHQDRGYIEVWLTNAEQKTINRKEIANRLLAEEGHLHKCQIVCFLSGSDNLYDNLENLLTSNVKPR